MESTTLLLYVGLGCLGLIIFGITYISCRKTQLDKQHIVQLNHDHQRDATLVEQRWMDESERPVNTENDLERQESPRSASFQYLDRNTSLVNYWNQQHQTTFIANQEDMIFPYQNHPLETIHDFYNWLYIQGRTQDEVDQVQMVFERENIKFWNLAALTDEDLKQLGFTLGLRKTILFLVDALRQQTGNFGTL